MLTKLIYADFPRLIIKIIDSSYCYSYLNKCINAYDRMTFENAKQPRAFQMDNYVINICKENLHKWTDTTIQYKNLGGNM